MSREETDEPAPVASPGRGPRPRPAASCSWRTGLPRSGGGLPRRTRLPRRSVRATEEEPDRLIIGLVLEQLRDQLRATYETQFGAEVGDLPDRDIGGESAYVLTMTRPSTSDPSLDVEQISYATVLDEAAYVITSSRVVDFPGTEAEVEEILDSWAWE